MQMQKLAIENNIWLQLGKKILSFRYVKFWVCQERSHCITFLVFEYFYSLSEKLSATLSAKLKYLLTNQNQPVTIWSIAIDIYYTLYDGSLKYRSLAVMQVERERDLARPS